MASPQDGQHLRGVIQLVDDPVISDPVSEATAPITAMERLMMYDFRVLSHPREPEEDTTPHGGRQRLEIQLCSCRQVDAKGHLLSQLFANSRQADHLSRARLSDRF